MFVRLRSRLLALVRRRRFEDGLSEELQHHVDHYAADLIASGMAPGEAARRARREFGNVDNIKDDCRQSRGLRLADDLQRDVRHAWRRLCRSRTTTITALVTLALCLGSNLTIFAVVDAVLLKPLPFPEPDRLMNVYNTYPQAGVPNDGCSLTNYYERRGQLAAFASISAYRPGTSVIGETGATERIPTTRVSPEFFATLGMLPAIGRAFTESEMAYGADHVAVLTDGLWRAKFAGDPNVLGRSLRVNGAAFTIVGVLPPGFRFLSSPAQVYLPLASDPTERTVKDRHSGNSQMVARLSPRVTVTAAQAEIDRHNTTLDATNPDGPAMAQAGFRSIVVSLQADHVASVRHMLLLVQAAALGLLLIGLVNLANLLLVSAGGRAKERAVQQALGAGRRHLVMSVLVETIGLTLAGAVLGLVAGAVGVRLLAAIGSGALPLGATIAISSGVVLVALAGAVVGGALLSVPVIWLAARDRTGAAWQDESRSSTGSRASERVRRAFIVAQVALAFMLLAGAGLLGRSLARVMAQPAGFQPDQVLTAKLWVWRGALPSGSNLLAFVDQLDEDLSRQPGVEAVGITTNVPLSGISNKSAVTVQNYVRSAGESLHAHYSYSVDGDFFRALGLNLVSGRVLTTADSATAERVCVVDTDFERRYWPGASALGHRVFAGSHNGPDADAFTIVGVVRPIKQAALTDDDALGAAFFPFGHRMDGEFFVVARTSTPPASFGGTLQSVVRRIGPELPVSDVRPMTARIDDSLVTRRSPALLAGIFGGIALLLTAVGTYGVISYAVSKRRREIGLRMALGAEPARIGWQFLWLGLRLLAVGTLIGAIGVVLVRRAMEAVLFDVPALDPITLVTMTAVLWAVAVVACLWPSRRASRISPLEAMTID